MKKGNSISLEDKDWRAKMDAEALTRAYEIKIDEARYKLAQEALRKQIKSDQEALDSKKKLVKK